MARRASPCVFCGLLDPAAVARCSGCGGPLEAPVGVDPGDPPAPAPRPIAPQWVRREVYQFPILWGLGFGGGGGGFGCFVGAVLTVAFLGTGLFAALPLIWLLTGGLASIFLLIGGIVFTVGARAGRRRLALYRDGQAALAEVVAVTLDGHGDPAASWTVHYTFPRDGARVGGSATWTSPVAAHFAEGDRLHVLFDPKDPSHNTPWPPPG